MKRKLIHLYYLSRSFNVDKDLNARNVVRYFQKRFNKCNIEIRPRPSENFVISRKLP